MILWARATAGFRPILRLLLPCLLLAGSVVFLTLVAPLDPDPHHDGIQLTPAIAVAQGLQVQSDAFSQYGPITVWLNSLAIWLFGDSLLTLRVLTAVLLGIAALFTFLLARRFAISTFFALLAGFSWLCLSPIWSIWPGFYHLWPWPSVTFLVLMLGAALAVTGLQPERAVSDRSRLWHSAVSGLLVGLAVITRPNYGIPALVALSVIVFLYSRRDDDARRIRLTFLLGSLIGVAVPLFELLRERGMQSYFAQAIFGPLGEHPAGTSLTYFIQTYLLGASVILVSLVLGFRFVSGPFRSSRLVIASITLLGASAFVCVLTYTNSYVNDFVLTRLSLYQVVTGLSLAPLSAAMMLVPVLCLMYPIAASRRVRPHTNALPSWLIDSFRVPLPLLLLAISALVQVYPVADPMHLWWCIPLPLILFFSWITRFRCGTRTKTILVSALFLPFLIIGTMNYFSNLSASRVAVNEGVLRGMYLREEWSTNSSKVFQALGQLTPRKNLFLCRDGLWAGFTGEYLANDAAFVDWAFGTDDSVPRKPEGVVLCTPTRDLAEAEVTAEKYELKQISEIGPLKFSEHTFSFWMYVISN